MLYYKDWGEGRPVVLLHGWPLSSDTWDSTAMKLVDAGHRCIMPDRRGFGRSDQPWHGHDYDTYADDIAAVLEDAGVRERVALVGFSMGGGEVARFLTRQGPDRVSHAVLASSVVPQLAETNDNPQGVPEATLHAMTEMMKQDRASFMEGFFKSFFGVGVISRPVSNEVLRDAWRQAMMAGLRPTLAAAEAFAYTDFRPDLQSFRVPTLVLHGTADDTVPIEATSKVVAERVPGARLIEYEGSPHGIFATDHERFAKDLVDFLGEGREDAPDQRSAIPMGQAAY